MLPVRDALHIPERLLLLGERPGCRLRIKFRVHWLGELSWAAIEATGAGIETAGVTETLAARRDQLLVLLVLPLLLPLSLVLGVVLYQRPLLVLDRAGIITCRATSVVLGPRP